MTKRERVAFAGFLLLAFGVEMVVVQQAVLRDGVAQVVVKRWGDEGLASEGVAVCAVLRGRADHAPTFFAL
jgi:hypothetical protein